MQALNVLLQADITQFESALKQAEKGLSGFVKAGEKMKDIGQSMSLYLTAPIALLGGSILKTAGDFEASMNRVSAITGAAGKDLEALTNQAKQLGIETKYSASEAAEAMTFLGMAGFDTKETLAAIPEVLNLAAAGAIDLGRAADIASNIMGQFGIEAENTARVTNVLAATASSSNTNIEQLSEAMKYLGPTAKALGASIEDTAAMVGILGDAGIQGSLAGRALGTSLVSLANPTAKVADAMKALGVNAFDAKGNFVGIGPLLKQIEEGSAGMTQQQKAANLQMLVGAEAFQEINILLERGSEAYSDYTKKITGTNKAQEMALKQSEGFNGMLKSLGSAWEGLQLAIANSGILEMFTEFGTKAVELVRSLAQVNPQILKFGAIAAGLVAAMGPLLVVLGSLATMLPTLAAGFAILTGPIGLIIAGIAAAAYLIISNWDTIVQYFTSGGGAEIFNKVKEIAIRAFDIIKAAVKVFIGVVTTLWDTFGGALIGYAKYAWDNISGVINGALDLVLAMLDIFKNLWEGNWGELWKSIINFAKVAVNTIIDIVAGILTAIPRMFNEVFKGLGIDNAITRGLDNSLKAVKQFVNDIKFETKGLGGELETVFEIKEPKRNDRSLTGDQAGPGVGALPTAGLAETSNILKDLQSEFDLSTKKFLTFGESFDVLKDKSGILENAINSLLANGLSPQSTLVQKLKGQLDALNNTGLDTLTGTFEKAYQSFFKFNSGAMSAANALKNTLKTLALAFEPVKVALADMSVSMRNQLEKDFQIAQQAAQEAAAMTDILQNAVGSVFAGMGDSLGNLFAGLSTGAGAIEQFGNTVLAAIADFAGQLGKYLIALGVAKMGLDNLFKAGPAGAAAAIGAGIALMALSKVVGNFASKGPNFGGGGGSMAPSVSGSAYRSPNAGVSYGAGGETMRFKIEGEDLVAIVNRANYKSGRLRG